MSRFDGISVIICCYNSSFDRLVKTLSSVLNQVDVNFDVVITDDGSKNEEFLKIIDWMKEHNIQNVKVNCNKTNCGTVKNILSAIPFCEYDFVKLISPGDSLYDKYSLKHYLECFVNDNATIVTGKSIYFNTENKIIPTPYPRLKQTTKEKYTKRNIIAYGDSILGASLAYEKSFLFDTLNKISPRIKLVEDYPLISICLLKGSKISFSNEILIWYEFGTGISTSKKVNPLFLKDFDELLLYLNENFDDKDVKFRYMHFKKRSKWSKLKKLLIYPFVCPSYFIFLIKAKFVKKPFYEKDISKMHDITTLHEC